MGNLGVGEAYWNEDSGTSLVVQWLGLRASTAGGTGSIPGQGTKIPQAVCTPIHKEGNPKVPFPEILVCRIGLRPVNMCFSQRAQVIWSS